MLTHVGATCRERARSCPQQVGRVAGFVRQEIGISDGKLPELRGKPRALIG